MMNGFVFYVDFLIGMINVFVIVVVFGVIWLLMIGIKESVMFNVILVVVKIVVLIMFVIFVLLVVD